MNYKTVLRWTKSKNQIIAFYKVNHGIGLIPAGIDFVHRGKRYSTMQALDSIKSNIPRFKNANFKEGDWYNMMDGTGFDKRRFMALRSS
jgi:hypothetical protein